MKSVLIALPLSIMSLGVSVQAAENCDGFTKGMTCFKDNTPAVANEVNANFQAVLAQIAKIKTQTGVGNVSYTRWGRNECPEGASLIYKGIAASGAHNQSGGISSLLCLIDKPTFATDKVNDGNYDGALLYGTEYETNNKSIATLVDLHDSDAPCAVCLKPQATLTLMIPGTINCPADWNKEYEGFLMGEHHSHPSSHDAACVDIAPELRPGSNKANQNGNLWYPTEAECGSLPCPPYVQNRELSCVVCTY
ncbi:MAG: hypothetical protein DRR16_09750 [Candidatus Parabeggiatoa sp. nov. 3]|nr:MAG: hypothetical protein DRR00_15330 [Gammaproteobacteria bacterium]RKZ86406.1 MAG: hypothetical protein DRR16_09750 [Gammaproteobacteria bacterium]HEW98346.1 hypothetical protein [Beggiatoa sp.]